MASKGIVGGVVVAGLGLVGVGYTGLGGQDDTTRTEAGEIVAGGDLGAFRIRLGDCFQDSGLSAIETVDAVPCSSPHMFEVFAAFNLSGESFPGTERIGQQADDGCYSRFEAFVGIEYEVSKYGLSSITPTAGSWQELDDREVLCLISNYDGSMKIGSARGTGE